MTLTQIQLSIVIPAYNAAPYIAECLHSVMVQTDCPPFEVIVVDDGSTDGTYEIVEQKFPEVRLFRQSNAGPGAARNQGAEKAVGEILIFHDADDVMLPGRLSAQGEYMVSHIHVMLSVGNCSYQSKPDYNRNGAMGIASDDSFEIVPNAHSKLMFGENFVSTGATAVRREAFLAIDGFRQDVWVAEDYALGLEIARRWPIAASCRFLTWYRQEHGMNLMASEHTYRGPVVVLMEELQSHGDLLNRTEYAAAHRRWCKLANMLLRRIWADFGRSATLQEMAALHSLLPASLWWKWQALTLIPAPVGRIARQIKRRVTHSQGQKAVSA